MTDAESPEAVVTPLNQELSSETEVDNAEAKSLQKRTTHLTDVTDRVIDQIGGAAVDIAADVLGFDGERAEKNRQIIHENVANAGIEGKVTDNVHPMRRIASHFPRSYYFLTQVLLPMEILISLSILFGWGIAKLESAAEIQRNDEILAALLLKYKAYVAETTQAQNAIGEAPKNCLNDYYSNQNLTELVNSEDKLRLFNALLSCAASNSTQWPILTEPKDYLKNAIPALTFYWTECPHDPGIEKITKSNYEQELVSYIKEWLADFSKKYDPLETTENRTYALYNASAHATGSIPCKVSTAGGALFWFTIMTTIGYGTYYPHTDGGRFMVYTCGFLCIIATIAFNATAGHVMLVICDDILHRARLSRFTKGPLAVLFWLCLLILWMLVLSLCVKNFVIQRTDNKFSLSRAYWFAFISTTTVGLGDLSIPPEEFEIIDMFYIPTVFLIGFAIIGNFAVKTLGMLLVWFPTDNTLEMMLEASRTSYNNKEKMCGEQCPSV